MSLINLLLREKIDIISSSTTSSSAIFFAIFLIIFLFLLSRSPRLSLLFRSSRLSLSLCYCGYNKVFYNKAFCDKIICCEVWDEESLNDLNGPNVEGIVALFLTRLLRFFSSKIAKLRRYILRTSLSNSYLAILFNRLCIVSRLRTYSSPQCIWSRFFLFFFRWSFLIRSLLMFSSRTPFARAKLYALLSFSMSARSWFLVLICLSI